jgi:DNA-binding NtrC family response regulator
MTNSVLIIEDDLMIGETVQELLDLEGICSKLTSNGEQALEYLRLNKVLPRLILLDLKMPVMDGFEFRKIQLEHSDFKNIPVVVMSADGEDAPEHRKLMVLDFLKKPADVEVILSVVKKYLH